jgi:hypothetical protein
MNLVFIRSFIVTIVALLLTACGSSESASSGTADIMVSDAWARAVKAEQTATVTNAVYFIIENDGDAPDQLLGAATQLAQAAEMHQTTLSNGVMQMRQALEVEIPAAETVTFEPGGYHLMLIGLTQSLTSGETFELTLTFANVGEITINVDVREF